MSAIPLTIRSVYSFSSCSVVASQISEILRKFELIAVQGHPKIINLGDNRKRRRTDRRTSDSM